LSSRAKLYLSKVSICCSSSSMRFTQVRSVVLCCGGGGRDVVVIIEVVAVDVGSGEPDCDVMRSITEVVIRGTEEMS
nr:hypothetical protein [Tanacetum cinerariifolium]